MKKLISLFVVVVCLIPPVISIADNKIPTNAKKEKIYTPGLGEIMTVTQMRHSKLWFSGKAANWKLAEYELFELQEGFDDAVKFHPDRSELLIKFTKKPIEQLKIAISENNDVKFERSFKALTNSCNACHKVANFEFNRVIIPLSNPFTNQNFTNPLK